MIQELANSHILGIHFIHKCDRFRRLNSFARGVSMSSLLRAELDGATAEKYIILKTN